MELNDALLTMAVTSYGAVVDMAIRLERSKERVQRKNQWSKAEQGQSSGQSAGQSKGQGSSSGKRKRGKNFPSSGPKAQISTGEPSGSVAKVVKCNHCGRNGHTIAECWLKLGRCLKCGSAEHRLTACPKFVPRQIPVAGGVSQTAAKKAPARVYALERTQVEDPSREGTLLVCGQLARPGSYAFVYFRSFFHLGRDCETSPCRFEVFTPMGKSYVANVIREACEVKVQGESLVANLVVLPIVDFDVILGMDWLATHRAQVDCSRKKVTLPGVVVEFRGIRKGDEGVTAVRALKLLGSDGIGSLSAESAQRSVEVRGSGGRARVPRSLSRAIGRVSARAGD